jgi:hypothetical protein
MVALGVLSSSWRVVAVGQGWRRATLVPRAAWVALPLPALVSPLDIPELRAALTDGRPRVLRVGTLGDYRRVRVEIGPWAGGCAPVVVEPLVELPISAWWLPEATYARLPAMPPALEA